MFGGPHTIDQTDTSADGTALAEAEADVAAGQVIPHAAMTRWLLSWGTADEEPPPECDA